MTVFGVVGVNELLDAVRTVVFVHQRMGREEHILGCITRHLDQIRRIIAVAADHRAGQSSFTQLLDDRANVVGHGRDVIEIRLLSPAPSAW